MKWPVIGLIAAAITAAVLDVGTDHTAHRPTAFLAVYAASVDQTADANHPRAIADTIEAANRWFADQHPAGREPRWVRDAHGRIEVRTVRLDVSAAELAGADGDALLDLVADGENHVVAFLDQPTGLKECALTRESYASVVSEQSCGIRPLSGAAWPQGATVVTAHEMTHAMGAVPVCAPHEVDGHVNDDQRDLLYRGPLPIDWDNVMLDPNHDDYFDHSRPDCPDIAHSAFWGPPR